MLSSTLNSNRQPAYLSPRHISPPAVNESTPKSDGGHPADCVPADSLEANSAFPTGREESHVSLSDRLRSAKEGWAARKHSYLKKMDYTDNDMLGAAMLVALPVALPLAGLQAALGAFMNAHHSPEVASPSAPLAQEAFFADALAGQSGASNFSWGVSGDSLSRFDGGNFAWNGLLPGAIQGGFVGGLPMGPLDLNPYNTGTTS